MFAIYYFFKSYSYFLGDISALDRNKSKRAQLEGTHPVYLIIKRGREAVEETPSGPGHHKRSQYAPKIIWAATIDDVTSWIENDLLHGDRNRKFKAINVENARAAYAENEDAYAEKEDIRDQNVDVADLKCVVVVVKR